MTISVVHSQPKSIELLDDAEAPSRVSLFLILAPIEKSKDTAEMVVVQSPLSGAEIRREKKYDAGSRSPSQIMSRDPDVALIALSAPQPDQNFSVHRSS